MGRRVRTMRKIQSVPNATLTPELLNLPEWDLGPKEAMQIDLLPNLTPSGGYENVLTASDDFSRYLFAYSLMDASAINVAKVLIDITTKHAYLPTTLITDRGTALTSTIIAEITQVLGISLKCATTKHPQTSRKLENKQGVIRPKTKAASLKEGDYCFVLQPKADHQGSKIPFRDYR